MARKIQPSVLTLNFDIGSKNINYIDLAKCLSEVNRRFYRQGMNYAIAGLRFGYIGNENPAVRVATLPQTWVVGAAWHKFFAKWQKQQNEALAESGSKDTKARYNDFKIYMDQFQKTVETGGSLRPLSPGGFTTGGGVSFDAGEWQYSNVVVPNDAGTSGNTVEYSLHMVGADVGTGAGIIKNYGLSRSYPHSPDPATPAVDTSILSRMFDVGENMDEIVDNAIDKNDDLPYDQDEYPNGDGNPSNGFLPIHREIQFTATTIGGHQNMEGCLAPCGLIQIAQDLSAPTNNTSSWLVMQVMLMPGNYKGVLAEPMQEMN